MNCKLLFQFLFITTALSQAGHSQELSLKDLKEYYKSQDTSEQLRIYSNTTAGIFQVFLIRHGEPDLEKKGWRNRDEAIQFMLDYDSATVIPFSYGPLQLDTIPADTILHSSLPRARHTAQLAFGQPLILHEDSNYREFERKTLRWCNMNMPTGFWTTSSRILWLLGFNDKDIEPLHEAKKRAQTNAANFECRARRDGNVILVAHGLHNKYVKKYLKKRGWKMVYNSGNGYLSVKVMALPPEIK